MTDRGFGCVVRSAELLLVIYITILKGGGEGNEVNEGKGGKGRKPKERTRMKWRGNEGDGRNEGVEKEEVEEGKGENEGGK